MRDSSYSSGDLATMAICVAVLAAFISLFTHVVIENRHSVPAKVLERTHQPTHTEAGVYRWDESYGKGSQRHYRAQLRKYPDRYWIRVHRKRFLAADTYEFQVDRATYEAAVVGKVIDRPHPYRADHELLAWGRTYKGGASYAWEPAWADAADLAREHGADIQRTKVWF